MHGLDSVSIVRRMSDDDSEDQTRPLDARSLQALGLETPKHSVAESPGGSSVLRTAELRKMRETQRRAGLLAVMALSGAGAVGLQFAAAKPSTHWPTTVVLAFAFVSTTVTWLLA